MPAETDEQRAARLERKRLFLQFRPTKEVPYYVPEDGNINAAGDPMWEYVDSVNGRPEDPIITEARAAQRDFLNGGAADPSAQSVAGIRDLVKPPDSPPVSSSADEVLARDSDQGVSLPSNVPPIPRRRPLPPDEPKTDVNLDFLYRSELAPARETEEKILARKAAIEPGARPKVPSNDIELREDSGQGLPVGGDLGGGPTRLGDSRPLSPRERAYRHAGRPLSPREKADRDAMLEGRDEDTSFYEQDRINSRNRNPLAAREGDGLGGSAARPIEYGQPGYREQWPLAFGATDAPSTADFEPTKEEKQRREAARQREMNIRPEAFDQETIDELIKQGYTPEEIRRMQMSPRDKERLNDSPGGRSYEAIYTAPGARESLAVRAPAPEFQHTRPLDPASVAALDSGAEMSDLDMAPSPSDVRPLREREGVQNRERQQSLKNQEMEDRGYVPTEMPGPNGPQWVYQLTPEAKARNRGRASQSRAERMAVLYDAPIPDGAISDDPDVRNAAWGADRLKYLKGKKADFEARNERFLNQVKMGRRSEAAWSAAGDIEDVDKRDAVRARMLGAPGADEGIAAGNIAAIKNLINQGFKGGGDDDPKLRELKIENEKQKLDAAKREGMTTAEIRVQKAGEATDALGKSRAYVGDSSNSWNHNVGGISEADKGRLKAEIERDHPDASAQEKEDIYNHVYDQTSWWSNKG